MCWRQMWADQSSHPFATKTASASNDQKKMGLLVGEQGAKFYLRYHDLGTISIFSTIDVLIFRNLY